MVPLLQGEGLKRKNLARSAEPAGLPVPNRELETKDPTPFNSPSLRLVPRLEGVRVVKQKNDPARTRTENLTLKRRNVFQLMKNTTIYGSKYPY